MPFAAFLLSIVGPILKRVFAALGFGIITYAGFQSIKDSLSTYVDELFGQMGTAIYQIISMAGFVDLIGIWLGALTTVAAMMAIKKLGVLAGG